jgi:hypothetical protein
MSGGAGTGGAGAPRVVVGIDGSVGARAALRQVVSAERSLPAHRRPSAGRTRPGSGHRRPGRGGLRGGRREPPVSPLGEHP